MQSSLLLWLQGPFQSYGYNSLFDIRDTALFPTKSAICGIICAAMGKDGEQEELLKKLVSSPLNVIAYVPQKGSYSIESDFQTIGTNYNPNDEFELAMIPKKSDGSKATATTGAMVISKKILEDLSFACILKYDSDFAEIIYKSLLEPIFPLCLGRKAYIPTEFIAQGIFQNDKELEIKITQLVEEKLLKKSFSVKECSDGEHLINDVPLCFGKMKKYASRKIDIVGLDESITL